MPELKSSGSLLTNYCDLVVTVIGTHREINLSTIIFIFDFVYFQVRLK